MSDEQQTQTVESPAQGEETLTSACILDCPDACGLEVTVAPGEAGRRRVTHIGGVQNGHPTTQGFICRKVGRFAERLEHRDRLLYPLRRTGPKGSGSFERISWDDALGEIARRLEEITDRWGGEAVLPCHYGGSNGALSDGFLDYHFFAHLGASRLDRTICAAPTSAVDRAMYGMMPGVAYEDYADSQAILVWGANPKASSIHHVPFLRQAKQNGAFITVIDPVRNFSSREVDLHLPVRPGADLPLALGMIHRWQQLGALDRDFLDQHAVGLEPLLAAAADWPPERAAEEAGVPVADLLECADRFAAASPAAVRCGWGLERNRNGGQAVAAVLAIPALLGKFGQRGSGYTLSNSKAGGFTRPPELQIPAWNTREINQSRLGLALVGEEEPALDPPVQALVVYNCNPLVTVPDQHRMLRGLEREDLFTVVSEQVMTDTALYADIVLPATTMLEHRDIRVGYGAYVVGASHQVVEPPGEARSNVETFAALGRAMGWDAPIFQLDDDSAFEAVVPHVHRAGQAVDPEILARGGQQNFDFPGSSPVQFDTVHPATPDGKIHLTPECLGPEPYRYVPPGTEDPDDTTLGGRGADAQADGPLTLITPATSELLNSTFGEFSLDQLTATLHPDEAASRNLAAGAPVRVHNRLGEVHCHLRLDPRVRPGVVVIPKGAWRRSSQNTYTSTALCPAHVNRVAGGACYNDARVEVEGV
ncbi:MAG: molybdopterin-dependent oxidoreductase [Acidobacteriota bacterium]|nr:molybdopterin-dependent oxidoreductase [Acidobacteriota bacterium]